MIVNSCVWGNTKIRKCRCMEIYTEVQVTEHQKIIPKKEIVRAVEIHYEIQVQGNS